MRRISKHFERRRKVVNGWEIGRLIGSGAWAEVRLAVKLSPNGSSVGASPLQSAVKIIRKKDLVKNPGSSPAAEIEILKRLCHPNTIKLIETHEDDLFVYMFLEYCSGGDLFELVAQQGRLDESTAGEIFSSIVDALLYVHSEGYAHRDLKLENIFLDDRRQVRIGDFGEAASKQHEPFNNLCGSPSYCSPELLARAPYRGEDADVWSLGCVLYTMLTGTMPYPPPEDGNPSSVLRDIRTTQLNFPAELSAPVVDLLKRMLELEVKDRIRLFEVRTHPWIIEHRSNLLNNPHNSSFESLPSMSSSPSLSSFDDLISPRDDSEKENKDNDKDGANSPPVISPPTLHSPSGPMSVPTSPVLSRLLAPSVQSRGTLDSALLSQKDV